MFEESKSVNSLVGKVEDLLLRYDEIRDENEQLRQEIVSVKAQNEAKDIQINRLQDELRSKELESDDIFAKIESVLGK